MVTYISEQKQILWPKWCKNEKIQLLGTTLSSVSDTFAMPTGHKDAPALPNCSDNTEDLIAG